jgi:hypothetical protein
MKSFRSLDDADVKGQARAAARRPQRADAGRRRSPTRPASSEIAPTITEIADKAAR